MYTHTYLQEDGSISGDTMCMLYTFKAKCRESQIFDMYLMMLINEPLLTEI